MIEECLTTISLLEAVPLRSADLYDSATERMINHVNRDLAKRPDIKELIGHNPWPIVELHNLHHVHFMLMVFRLNSFELLVRTLPWFYRVNHLRNFSYDYFPVMLQSWKIAIQKNIAEGDTGQIVAVYDWMSGHHETMIQLSRNEDTLGFSLPVETDGMQQIFSALLLKGDRQGCLKLVEETVNTPDELRHFYDHVVKNALYTVGALWERNELSVAEEHLATAIIGRIMSALYLRFIGTTQTKGKAIVSAAPNEFHEVGARMVADILELDGWDVNYLDVNTSTEELVALLKQQKPFILALAVATAFNLKKAKMVIETIKNIPELSTIRILVGGFAFSNLPRFWQELAADGYAANLADVTAQCNTWWQHNLELR